ncbi:MAG: nitroreductase [Pseudomonadota bacterium]
MTLLKNPQSLSELIRARRTVSVFEDREVSRERLLDAIDVARWAPNHRMTEPWRFYLFGPDARAHTLDLIEVIATERVDAEMGQRKRASWSRVPAWVLVTCPFSQEAIRQQEDYAACACAIHNLSLCLWESGIGMKWSTGSITRDHRYLDALGIDVEAEFVVGLLMIGYPKTVPQKQRKAVESIVTQLA